MRKLVIGSGLVFLVAAVLVWIALPVGYEAYALLKVSSKAPSVFQTSGGSTEAVDFELFKRTQAELLRSNMVMFGTVREPAISKLATIQAHNDGPGAWLGERIMVSYPDDSEIMRVALRGTEPGDLVKIVNEVVKKYMSEIVQRERDLRLEQEGKLDKAYQEYSARCSDSYKALKVLEQTAKVSGTGAAQANRLLAEEVLRSAIADRNGLRRQLRETNMQIMLMEMMKETGNVLRTADFPQAKSDDVTLPMLERQKEFLEDAVQTADEDVVTLTKNFGDLDQYSSQATVKAEEVRGLQALTSDIKRELDRLRLERLAPERIIKLDDAVLVAPEGDWMSKYTTVSILGLAGIALVLGGLSMRRSTEKNQESEPATHH